MLRQEGLMHCILTSVRRQRAAGYLDPVSTRSDHTDQNRRMMELERENRKLKRQLEPAEALIEVQQRSLACWRRSRRTRKRAEESAREAKRGML